ncbi:hypothetical protein N4T20_20175 [Flavobacterium sp. TR2]|uniref:hypothetical protein n=1 Tax=Flavobacterium sp. TR2 TaxID=2977321 RepID=UPI0021B0FE5D|nr:hypothetical protein [Flavobacterium sp. TR2]UWY28025.1 hypothetical protein N4T20_20175 [Flavobacterium sp. TR2]
MNKYAIILWIFLLPLMLFSQKKVRVVDNKGTVTYVDSSKWFKVGDNIFNKNKNFSVGIGVDTTAILAARLVVKGEGISPLVLQDLLQGTSTDKLLTWDSATGAVRQTDAGQFAWLTKGNAGTTPGTNFLGTTDAKDLVIKTNATEAIRINASQNVGIGTAAPNNKLEISQGTAGNSGLRLTNLTNAVAPTVASSKFLTVDANGDVVLRNVGENIVDFNTANPNSGGPVFVPNDLQNPDVTYLSTIDNSTWAWSVGQNKYVPATPSSTAWLQGGNTMAGQQAIGTKNNYDLPIITNNIEAMRIDASQKVGIGTATPTEKLEVKGTVSANNYTTPVQATATGAAYTWDLSKGATAKWTLSGGNNTLTVSNAKAGMYGTIIVTNSGTSTLIFAAGSNKVINGGGGIVTLTPLAGAVDILSFMYDGTTFWWTVGNNYN